jgi:hypothetical protein
MKKKEMRRRLGYAFRGLKSIDSTRMLGVDTISLGHAEYQINLVLQGLREKDKCPSTSSGASHPKA